MAYNPGVSYRGEILGQSIGAAGQSIAQSYGQGLRLQEEQKRYDDVMKQRRRDRKNLKKSYGMQAELLGVDKEDIDTMGLGELQGLVEGTKLKSSLDFQGLQLQQLQGDIEQTAAGKRAVGQMQMYIEKQNLSPVDAATNAARDEGLELGEAAKLLNLATAGEKLGLELRTILARERGLDLQETGQGISERAVKVQEKQLKRSKRKGKKPATATATDVPNLPSHKLVTIGDKSQLVKVDEGEEAEAMLSPESAKVTTAVESIYSTIGEDVSGFKAGEVKYGLGNVIPGGWYRDDRIIDNAKTAAKANRSYKRQHGGKDHPEFIDMAKKMLPRIAELLDSPKKSEKELGEKWRNALGLVDDRKKTGN